MSQKNFRITIGLLCLLVSLPLGWLTWLKFNKYSSAQISQQDFQDAVVSSDSNKTTIQEEKSLPKVSIGEEKQQQDNQSLLDAKQLVKSSEIAQTIKTSSEPKIETSIDFKPSFLPSQTKNYHVASTVVNVYRDPATNSEVVTQALYGESVNVLDIKQSWVKISLPDQFNYQGWIQRSVLAGISENSGKLSQKMVTIPNAEIKIEAKKEAAVLLQLPLGSVVTTIPSENSGNFASVKLIDGRKGYILAANLADYSQKNTSEVSRKSILNTASQLLGQPYLWGGMTTGGVDCSGFVHTVFKVHGIRLHRDADLQYVNDGNWVARTDLQPGDLIFFETYQPGASHVGIYAGNRKFIQASSKGVNYSSLDNAYYSNRFIGAKRILTYIN